MARSNIKHTARTVGKAPTTKAAKDARKTTAPSVGYSLSARPARPLFRLIPVTMGVVGALFCLKAIEVFQAGRVIHQELLIGSVQAQQTPDTASTAAPRQNATATQTTDSPEAGNSAQATEAEALSATPAAQPASRRTDYNHRELDVLENLSERRKRLDQLEREIALREKVLQATEERINSKLVEMNEMSEELKELLVTYEKEEMAKIASLVKIYEAMKPKDAARIFDELDMNILLLVVDRMSERRVAPVLAAMSPQKAKDVTEQLAEQQKKRPRAVNQEVPLQSPPLF